MEVATTARAFGWTTNEVRATPLRDLHAYGEILQDEARKQRMRQAAAKVKG